MYYIPPAPTVAPTAAATPAMGPTARNLAVLGDWEQPVYTRPDPPNPPEKLAAHDGLRMRQAAARAKTLYPGAVGECLADHLQWVADTGWALTAGAKTLRLVDEIMRPQDPQ